MQSKWDFEHEWELLLPPSRPAQYQLDIIREILNSISKEAPIGVLGSTPEYRDLLASNDFHNIYVFDDNISFYKGSDKYRAYNNPEKLIHGSWTEMLDDFADHFHLILSDLTSGNVPYERHEKFYNKISNSLVEGGKFVDKILKNDAPPQDLDDLDNRYRQKQVNLRTLNNFHNEYFFTSELTFQHGIVDVDQFYSILNDRFENPVLRKLLEENDRLAPSGSVWYYGRPWKRVRSDYFNSLDLTSEVPEPENSPFQERASVLISEPK